MYCITKLVRPVQPDDMGFTEAVSEGASSPRATLVYLYVASTGGTTTAAVAESLGMNKTTLFPIFRTLCEDGQIRKMGARCTTA